MIWKHSKEFFRDFTKDCSRNPREGFPAFFFPLFQFFSWKPSSYPSRNSTKNHFRWNIWKSSLDSSRCFFQNFFSKTSEFFHNFSGHRLKNLTSKPSKMLLRIPCRFYSEDLNPVFLQALLPGFSKDFYKIFFCKCLNDFIFFVFFFVEILPRILLGDSFRKSSADFFRNSFQEFVLETFQRFQKFLPGFILQIPS